MRERLPNVVLVRADQLAAQALPLYGHGIVKAPHLEALAGGGVVFDNAYCNAPLCAPSRFSMLSARLPSRIGAFDNAAEAASVWDARALKRRVIESQRRRRLVFEAQMAGRRTPWDFQPPPDAARRFVRNDAVLGDTERRARLPLRAPPAPDGVSRNRHVTIKPRSGS